MQRTVDTHKLYAVLLAATERVIVYLKQVAQDEHLYAFGLYTNGRARPCSARQIRKRR